MSVPLIQKFESEFSAHVRARYPLLYLSTYEEARAIEVTGRLCQERGCQLLVWSRTQGVTRQGKGLADITDPMGVLRWYDDQTEKSVLVLKDFHPYLKEPGILRKLRDLAQSLKRSPKNIVLLSPVLQIPAELAKDISVLDLPLPEREEIKVLVEKAQSAAKNPEQASDLGNLVDAACGLTYDEIENVLAKSLVSKGVLDKKLILDEKKQIVKKSGLVEFVDTDTSGSAKVGGLDHLKSWLRSRKRGLSDEARSLKLPCPKGILLVGVPGCGKSLTAVTVGREWELPLLRLDLGKIFSGLVGSSESNIRSALATVEAVSPCILWIDEIEKGLSGAQSSGQSDGGTTSRVFGTLLTWMQEKQSPVFVVATANDISGLPPELLRKGRFDEIFFVDLPRDNEREDIFGIHLNRFGWEIADFDLEGAVKATDGFSGSEIEQAIVAGRYLAFGAGVPFQQNHLIQAVQDTVPLSRTMRDRIDALRSWASTRARPASLFESQKGKGTGFEARRDSLEVAYGQ